MQTAEEILEELNKLLPSQRSKMRKICGNSILTKLKVTQIGWKTRIECTNYNNFCYSVDLGPKGGTISKTVWEAQ